MYKRTVIFIYESFIIHNAYEIECNYVQKLGKHQMNFNKDVVNKHIQVYCVQ